MEAEVQRLLDIFADLREKANVNACFGERVTVEGRTIIPVASVSYGFGAGLGQGPSADKETDTEEQSGFGGGGGGGMNVRPLGTIEVTAKGTRIRPIVNEQKVALVGMLVGVWTIFWLARTITAIFGEQN